MGRKISVEIDEEMLHEVKRILGTRTNKDTLNTALDEVIRLEARRRAFLLTREMVAANGMVAAEAAEADSESRVLADAWRP